MKEKKMFSMLFLVSVLAIFAWMVYAEFADTSISVDRPLANTNYSGSLLLNATLNNTYESNATNVTFFFYNASGDLVYNETFENSTSNQSRFNYTIVTSSVLADGTYNLTVNATNGSRVNSLENSTITGIQIDNTAPSVTINAPANNTYLGTGGSLVFNVTVTDSGSGVLTTIDIQNNSETNEGASQVGAADSREFNRTVVVAELAEGSNTFTVVANDTITAANGGINTNNSETVVIWLDTAAPSVALPGEGILNNNYNNTWTTDRTPSLTFNYTDANSPNATCRLYVDGVTTATNQTVALNNSVTIFEPSSNLDLGTHTWGVNCTDLGGNVAQSANNFTIDVVDTITVTTPTNNSWTNEVRGNGTTGIGEAFTFSFASDMVANAGSGQNNASCELWITNASGVFLRNGNNTVTTNGTATTIYNNQTLVSGLATNWTINCTYNGTDITQAVNNGYFTLNVDNVTPTVTLSRTSVSSSSQTIAISTASDVSSCSANRGTPVGSGSSWTITDTGLNANTLYSYIVTCSDAASNSGSSTGSFRTSASTGGGGAGGAGSGIASSVAGTFAKEIWQSINAGETASVEVANGAIGVTEVSFAVDKTTYGAWVKVEKVASLPSSVQSFGGSVYRNIKITESNVEKALKEKAAINFKVEKSWLAENSIDKSGVALFRYADDSWNALPTTMGEDDGTYVHYSAETPGFSYFVIGQKAGVVATEAAAAPETAPSAGETAGEEVAAPSAGETAPEVAAGEAALAEEKKSMAVWLIPLIVLIVLGVGLYFYWKSKQG